MNILRIVYDWPDLYNITEGLAPAPYELSISQARLGHKIFVLCGNLNGKNLKAKRFYYELESGKICVYNLPRAIKWFGPFLTTSFFVLPYYFYLKWKFGFDVLHNHGHLGVWLLAYKYFFKFIDKISLVSHFHITAKGREKALIEQNMKLSFASKYIEYPIHKFSDFLSAKIAKQIIVVAGNIAEELMLFYKVPEEKIHVVESGADTARFRAEGEKVDFGFSKDSKIIINIGRLSKRKNIDMLVKSLSLLPVEYKLVLAGKWDTNIKEDIYRYINEHNLNDRFKYIGSLSYFDVDKYYRSAEFFVLPSSYEGLPKVVIEALASGCKVLASGFKISHSLPNLDIIDTPNIESIVNGLKKLESKESEYNKTREILEEFYSWDAKANYIEKIYAKI